MKRMSFEEFKERVVKDIKAYLPERFADAEVSIGVVKKNNDLRLTALTIRNRNVNIAPTIYLDQFYKEYENGIGMGMILQEIADLNTECSKEEDFDISQVLEYEKCKDKIIPRLVNAEWNKDLLQERPHVMIADLAAMFVVDLGTDSNGSMSMPVTYDLMSRWGITVDVLYKKALQNMPKIDKHVIMPLSDAILQIMLNRFDGGENDMSVEAKELAELMQDDNTMDMGVYIVTNLSKVNGASMILDEATIKEVIATVGTDFYIIPSSIHEVLIFKKSERMDRDEIRNMVKEINAAELTEEERLSDNIYTYTEAEGFKIA